MHVCGTAIPAQRARTQSSNSSQLREEPSLVVDWTGWAAQVEDALIMGADYYETLEECALIPGCLPMGIGAPQTLKTKPTKGRASYSNPTFT